MTESTTEDSRALYHESALSAAEPEAGASQPRTARCSKARRKVLIVALNYAPEMVGCAKYTAELAEALAQDGYRVEVICAPPYYPQWKILEGYSGASWRTEILNGVLVRRVPLFVPKKVSGLTRILHLASFGAATVPAALSAAFKFKPDLVFTVAPTLTSSFAALIAAKIAGARSWLHIQDFEVDAAFELGLLKSRIARRLALFAERLTFRAFDRVSTISPAMARLLHAKGVGGDAIVELRNWVDVESIPTLPSTNTSYRSELAIDAHDIVALYSGNMAAKQGIEMLADVARQIHEGRRAAVTFIFCGEGPARASLEAACSDLSNVRFLPLQPLERLGELLGTADVHLLPQRPEAADLVLPSKLTGMLASGRPVIAMAMPGSSLEQEVQGAGIAVEPTAKAMAVALDRLATDAPLRRELGAGARHRAEAAWQKSAIYEKFVGVIHGLDNCAG
ncbi:WcaI family glycosyltransferase [Caulobacter sp. RL271]|uniref:WcaI family glycosyltransferase n=1 Tax=Caulobacter segnis TaxID=88688 RepID=A0ABY4ZNA5_9CAUL|nr:WcaI family glycosyltransferase [Caulobacter segnis]USQ94203.1 WcaI family glycosyltransferase [Caulobacter segnis]